VPKALCLLRAMQHSDAVPGATVRHAATNVTTSSLAFGACKEGWQGQ